MKVCLVCTASLPPPAPTSIVGRDDAAFTLQTCPQCGSANYDVDVHDPVDAMRFWAKSVAITAALSSHRADHHD